MTEVTELLLNCMPGNNNNVFLIFCVSVMITRSPGSTTGTSRTKPARVTRRTTSLSSEMEMVFTITSSRPGKSWIRGGTRDFHRNKCCRCIFRSGVSLDCYTLESLVTAFLLSCRVRLSKRRAKAGAQSTTNAVLVCKHRDMNEKELEAQVRVLFILFLLGICPTYQTDLGLSTGLYLPT